MKCVFVAVMKAAITVACLSGLASAGPLLEPPTIYNGTMECQYSWKYGRPSRDEKCVGTLVWCFTGGARQRGKQSPEEAEFACAVKRGFDRSRIKLPLDSLINGTARDEVDNKLRVLSRQIDRTRLISRLTYVNDLHPIPDDPDPTVPALVQELSVASMAGFKETRLVVSIRDLAWQAFAPPFAESAWHAVMHAYLGSVGFVQEVLRSPCFNPSEAMDIFAISHPEPQNETALEEMSSSLEIIATLELRARLILRLQRYSGKFLDSINPDRDMEDATPEMTVMIRHLVATLNATAKRRIRRIQLELKLAKASARLAFGSDFPEAERLVLALHQKFHHDLRQQLIPLFASDVDLNFSVFYKSPNYTLPQ
ncbi:hypothetical protein Purlil1_2066 [Purpureocillium lilacinum]|uniref:Uncharacterized protein n=1 Tax=Purpureocillium lilacinum TaxID=33203 RepID=A0ABR0CC42_PURLI|nr:hypothetical protein Purlil1_2066 [Purpureocillium lilacinum]